MCIGSAPASEAATALLLIQLRCCLQSGVALRFAAALHIIPQGKLLVERMHPETIAS
jgi:hypothetical protein